MSMDGDGDTTMTSTAPLYAITKQRQRLPHAAAMMLMSLLYYASPYTIRHANQDAANHTLMLRRREFRRCRWLREDESALLHVDDARSVRVQHRRSTSRLLMAQ